MEAKKQEESPAPREETALVRMEPTTGDGTIQAFSSQQNFVDAQRMAKALASSSLIPKEYQGNIPNCLIAMELAGRVGVSVFAAMQNLDIIHGRPSWRATFLVACVNATGRFTSLRFRFSGVENSDDWGCRAYATDRATKEECVGTNITISMAKAEGWYGKNGSKWKTMPEQMLMYRAASFWSRIYAPEISLGMQTSDELRDVHDGDMPGGVTPGDPSSLEARVLSETSPDPSAPSEETEAPSGPVHDPETGEVPTVAREERGAAE